MSGPIWICDYDVPVEPRAKRMAFYRALWKILRTHRVVTIKRSTMSVWITDNKQIAKDIHSLALQYGRSRLYNATPIT